MSAHNKQRILRKIVNAIEKMNTAVKIKRALLYYKIYGN